MLKKVGLTCKPSLVVLGFLILTSAAKEALGKVVGQNNWIFAALVMS